jgi:SAM-dependent methyltransferase
VSALDKVERYYSSRFAEHGASARGVDWNGEDSQRVRFGQLLRVADRTEAFSLVDYGCGYGALAPYLDEAGLEVDYVGYDLSQPMIAHAAAAYGGPRRRFVAAESELGPADFAVASGIFNVKLDEPAAKWKDYVVRTIERLSELGRNGFAFNMLTSYSDPERMRDDLFYGDPAFFFDLCKREHSRHVALLHDYGLWEFTVVVRKDVA